MEPTLAFQAKEIRNNPKLIAAQPGVLQALKSEGAPAWGGRSPLVSRASVDGMAALIVLAVVAGAGWEMAVGSKWIIDRR
jgi:hypothetical protein